MALPTQDPIPKEQIYGRECKHAHYTRARSDSAKGDLITIKEIIHDHEGNKYPRLRLIENYKRPFWITKPGLRDHQELREWESLENCDQYQCTQSNLVGAVKQALGIKSASYQTIRQIANDYPYVYGTDITPTAIIKHKYQQRFPDCVSDCEVAVFDIETDMVEGHEEPNLLSITSKNKAYTVIPRYFANMHSDKFSSEEMPRRLKEHFYRRLPETAKERGIELEVEIAETTPDAIIRLFHKAHEWAPDFLVAWNMNFDIPRMLDTLERYNVDIGHALADPNVPMAYHRAFYKEGSSQKVTDSGDVIPRDWYDRWHTFYLPASFHVVDQACVFWRLRMAGGKEPSYSLDAILNKYAGIKKLKNEEADRLSGGKWHTYMQRHQPLEYGVYNLYDCIACEILDEQPKIGDLRLTFYMQAGHSDYDVFNKQPRMTVDDMHFTALENGKVIAATPKHLKTQFDNYTTSRNDWIVTLPAHLVDAEGLEVLNDAPDIRTLIFGGVYDLDITSAYPTGENVLNTSKSTTVAEISKIHGVEERIKRYAGINLTGGSTNAAEICQSIMGAPRFGQLLEQFKSDHGIS